MSATEEKNAIAKKFIAGLRNRNEDLLRSIMTDDLVWILPGTSLISGAARGVDAVVKRSQIIVDFGVNFNLKHVLIGHSGVEYGPARKPRFR